MMAWRRDPATGEWVMVDTTIPDPMTQGVTGQEPNPSARSAPPMPPSDYGPDEASGYHNPNLRSLPDRVQSSRSDYPPDAGGYADPDLGAPQGPIDTSMGGGYQNYDPNAYAQWVQEVEARGNEVRETAVGCFEVDSGGRIVSRAPSGYAVN